MDMDRYIGKLLDNRYEILEVIGTGGMAVVYKARCHRLNRLVAIKILKDENLQDEDFRRRFHAEGQAVGMLSHPNIVSVYDVSTSGDADYIVMELIDGISLKQYMEMKGVLNWKETLHFATQIAKGLEHAHSRGLVHRDIKPHNVMLLKNGSVRVTDFGIARVMSNSNTLTKETLGSVHYISPEQAKGSQVDSRSDLYSLGVVMYEMITGRTPFDGESPVSVAIQHIAGGAVKPSVINPNVPKGLEQIIMKAMAHDLRYRYASATAMLADMDEFRKDPTMVFPVEKMNQPAKPVPLKTVQPSNGGKPRAAAPKSVDDKTQVIKPVTEAAAKEAARKKKRQPRTRDYVDEEISRGRIATAAVITCSIAVMVAVVIFLAILIGGGETPPEAQLVEVPDLKGIDFEYVPNYDDLEVVEQLKAYSDEYGVGKIINQLPEPGEMVEKGRTIYVTVSLGPRPEAVKIKNLVGMDKTQAYSYLQSLNMGLDVSFKEAYHESIPAGQVTKSEPAEGQSLRKGQKVTLTISLGRDVQMNEMPNLLRGSYSKSDAESILNVKGFTNVEWVPVNSKLPLNQVVSQSVAAGEMIDITTPIVIEYSNGIPPEKQPVTIQYTIEDLPVSEEDCTVSLFADGNVVVSVEMKAGETSVTVTLTGKGQVEYIIFIDGVGYRTITIDFDEYDEE